jgi:hypothetical protein
MKQECEGLFIKLVSPYITAAEAGRVFRKDDWFGVLAFANTLRAELDRGLDIDEPVKESFGQDIKDLGVVVGQLVNAAVNQVDHIIHHREPREELSNEAMALTKEINSKWRKLVIDNVCACENR